MFDLQTLLERRNNRRGFLKTAAAGALGLAGAGLLTKNAAAAGIPGGLDAAVLNFALNLEYLEAEYYTHATTGGSLETLGIPVKGSDGTPSGPVTTKATSTKVPFASTNIAQYAAEIAKDEQSHVVFIQNALKAVGVPYVARPAIDLVNSFAALGALIGVPGFDPFASDTNFLLGAYIFEDVGVTAYHGGAGLLSNKNILGYAAGILAVEAYHAGLVRTVLFEQGQGPATQAISNVRIMFGGTSKDSNGMMVPPDAGVTTPTKTGTTSNIVVSDDNAIAFSRTTQQVINIVYASASGKPGGFFPNGLNGFVK